MTTKHLLIGGGVAIAAWLLFLRGDAEAAPAQPAAPAMPPATGKGAGVASDAGVVGDIVYHADGSVTECEQDLWSGRGKVCKRYTAAEWAAKESAINAALDAGLAESDAYSILTYQGGGVLV